jgi:hypothetical protein
MMQVVLDQVMLGKHLTPLIIIIIIIIVTLFLLVLIVKFIILLEDYLEEILEMITTFTYMSNDRVSPAMWSLFPSIYACFKSGAYDYFSGIWSSYSLSSSDFGFISCCFIIEMLPCFDNYISRDPKGFISNPQAVTLTIDIVTSVSVYLK